MSAHPFPQLGPSPEVAKLVKAALQKIEELNRVSLELSGDLCYSPAGKILEALLDNPETRFGVCIALAEYVCSAIDGNPLDIEKWQPLARFENPQKVREFKR